MSAYRSNWGGGDGGGGFAFAFPRLTPVVKIVMIVCGVLQIAQLATKGGFGDYMDVSAAYFSENPIRGVTGLFTYMWVHAYSSLGHVVFNMLGLWFFGSFVEEQVGSRRFFWIYVACALTGGVFWVGASALSGIGHIPVVGASGGVYGVLCYAAFLNPRMRVILILFPVMLGWLVGGLALFAVYDMIVQLQSGGRGGTAHAAHVGGMVAGFVAYKLRGQLGEWSVRREARAVEKERSRQRESEDELDRILKKIKDEGMSKLTKGERRFLEMRSKDKS